MTRGVKKENLPTKICVTCNRPFTWRKKWEKVWDEVTTCSKSCNRQRRQKKAKENLQIKLEQNNKTGGHLEAHGEIDIIVDSCDESQPSIQELNVLLRDDLSLGSSQTSGPELDMFEDQETRQKAERKAEKKRKKEMRREQREGRGDPTAGQKQCNMCDKSVDLLIRCTYDETLEWKMVCGKCWKTASGGVVDGDASHPYYKYGGLWKNRRRK